MSLQASINLPSPQDHPADPFLHQGTTSLRMIGLFRSFDEVLVSLWTKSKGECAESYLATLDKQLQEVLPPYLNDTQAQLSEMPMIHQWLKHKAWGLSVANGTGSSTEGSYVDSIHDLLPMASHFPGNLGLHGLSLCENLFNVTCALTEILAILPAPRTPFVPGPQDQLRKILNIVTVIRNGDHRFLPLLMSKVTAALPRLASPMLQNAPETAAVACNMDLFDGFGDSSMCPAPVYGDYEHKFAVPRFDEMSSDSNSPNGPPSSSNDMSSPFSSSPSIMSPSMDLPHHSLPDFNSMPDMVMSPISHGPPSSLGSSAGMNTQQPQHSQHSPLSPYPSSNSQMQGLSPNNNINPPPNINLASQMHLGGRINTSIAQAVSNSNSNLMARAPPPQRNNSFAMGLPQIRTVGDFQALQRVGPDMNPMASLGMSPLGPDMDFNSLSR